MPAKVEGLQNVLANIRGIIPAETEKMNAKLAAAGNVVEIAVKNQASLTDHTLKQLADMGHPYSKRYPVNSGPHGDDSLVHKQSGTLYENIEKEQELNTIHSSVAVGVSENKVPYIGDLITGNGRQRPRNFIGSAFNQTMDQIVSVTQGK